MAQALNRIATVKGKASVEEIRGTAAEIDAKDFERAQQDPRLRDFVKAADERLEKLRTAGQID
jgi:hypothetical protein